MQEGHGLDPWLHLLGMPAKDPNRGCGHSLGQRTRVAAPLNKGGSYLGLGLGFSKTLTLIFFLWDFKFIFVFSNHLALMIFLVRVEVRVSNLKTRGDSNLIGMWFPNLIRLTYLVG
jgi:hypothetical protein